MSQPATDLPPTDPPDISGVLPLDKPAGISCGRIVNRVKGTLRTATGRKLKVGHAGTLDPFATGLLIIMVGRSTRLAEAFMNHPKTYLATVTLGATTPTDDHETAPEPFPNATTPTLEQIQNLLPQFTGQITQQPPVFSALRVAGKRAYDLARKGRPPTLAPRPVMVYDLQLLTYTHPHLHLSITCGRGTYIRAIARDIGQSLACGGYLSALRRTASGGFAVEHATSTDTLTPANILTLLHPITPPRKYPTPPRAKKTQP